MIKVNYSDFTEGVYGSLEEAKIEILTTFNYTWGMAAGPVVPERIVEVDSNDEEIVEFGCFWDIRLEELV